MLKRIFAVIVVSIFCASCVEQKDIEFFSKNGVKLGLVENIGEGNYFLPIEFKTQILNSAQWLYDVKYEIQGHELSISALYSVPPNGKTSVYKGGIWLTKVEKGTYKVFYQNKDKSKDHLGLIVLR